jgi:hypothetical protein
MRTSENSVHAKFAEIYLPRRRWIRGKKRPPAQAHWGHGDKILVLCLLDAHHFLDLLGQGLLLFLLSPTTIMVLYCSCAADSPPPGFIVPAPWPPEPEEPFSAWDEEKGAAA